MAAPGLNNNGNVGTTVDGYTIIENNPGAFSVTGTISNQPFSVPDDSYTYVGSVDVTDSSSGTFAGTSSIFYSAVTGLYFVDSVDAAPANSLPVASYNGSGDGSTTPYTTAYTDGSSSSYDYSTETESITPCFCPGTLIAIPTGAVPVESLAVGDLVMTASGAERPVRWIGRRSYDGRFVAGNRDVMPVCIREGAIDGLLPCRDLWVSPLHALLLDGVLVPAGLLVNGVSIVQDDPPAKVRYLHVELDSHDVLLAEGVAAESFVDDGGRGMFQNAGEYHALYPDAVPASVRYCARRIEDGEQLARIKRAIDGLAGIEAAVDAPGVLRGHLDDAGPGRVSGWAQDVSRPEAPVCLDVMADGVVVGQVLADRFRDDLRRAGVGSGGHAFEWELPSTVSGPVTVRRSVDGVVLDRTVPSLAA